MMNLPRPPSVVIRTGVERGGRAKWSNHFQIRSLFINRRPSQPSHQSSFPSFNCDISEIRRRSVSKLDPVDGSSNPLANSSVEDDGKKSSADGGQLILRAGEMLSMAFPLFVGSACLPGLWRPSSFLWVGPRLQILFLIVTMLGMGMTLTLDDLRAAFLMPKELAAGFVLQYTVMPLSGFFVSKLLKLPSHYAAGLILVACCPGGTASNIVTYLARGNVALSVVMTAASTFAASLMTPLLTSKLAGQFVEVDPAGLFISTVQPFSPVLLLLRIPLPFLHLGCKLCLLPFFFMHRASSLATGLQECWDLMCLLLAPYPLRLACRMQC